MTTITHINCKSVVSRVWAPNIWMKPPPSNNHFLWEYARFYMISKKNTFNNLRLTPSQTTQKKRNTKTKWNKSTWNSCVIEVILYINVLDCLRLTLFSQHLKNIISITGCLQYQIPISLHIDVDQTDIKTNVTEKHAKISPCVSIEKAFYCLAFFVSGTHSQRIPIFWQSRRRIVEEKVVLFYG